MDQRELLERLRDRRTTLYKLTGPPAHWLTTFHTGFWGLPPQHGRVWDEDVRAGHLALLHSTAPKFLSDVHIQGGIIGIGRISGKSEKDTLEWYDEIKHDYNGWPYLIHFSEVWWFGDTGAVRDEPIRQKLERGAGALVRDARALTAGAISFREMMPPSGGCLISAQGSIALVSNPAAFVPLVQRRLGEAKAYGPGENGGARAPRVREPHAGAPRTEGPSAGLNPGGDGEASPDVATGTRVSPVPVRVGQQEFSSAVRANYRHRCCFPGCEVADDAYLVGAHIVRWADDEETRGRIDNGLCLCLMHDRAFERGHFFLDDEGRVRTSTEQIAGSSWARKHVLPSTGSRIRTGEIPPSREFRAAHRARVEKKV